MTTKISGSAGIEFPDSTDQASAAFSKSESEAEFLDQAELLAQFASLLSPNGYTKLPNGLIIQWGSGNSSAGTYNFTYPIPFPNAVFQVVGVCAVTANIVAVVQSQGVSAAAILTHIGNSGAAATTPVRWIAIGY